MVAKGAIIAVSLAAAAAIAVYESPDVQRFAEQFRRRIAIALHSLGDEINPNSSRRNPEQPRFNRPEDAEGFMRSAAEASGVDADEESKRRQREELMYWNRLHLERKEKERQAEEKDVRRGSNFDDFLHEDTTASEKGTYVYNTGADVQMSVASDEGLFRRRGEGARGLDRGALYANPFADEHNIEMEDQHTADSRLMSSAISEDIYTANDLKTGYSTPTLAHEQTPQLIDISDPPISVPETEHESASVYEFGVENEEYVTAGQAQPESAYASIQAWADSSASSNDNGGANFYSPLPHSPRSAPSEPEEFVNSDAGMATPTDSASLAGSGEDVARDDVSEAESKMDVLSDEGISTPGTWTEVGSVVSESEGSQGRQ